MRPPHRLIESNLEVTKSGAKSTMRADDRPQYSVVASPQTSAGQAFPLIGRHVNPDCTLAAGCCFPFSFVDLRALRGSSFLKIDPAPHIFPIPQNRRAVRN
jgi:hypothetical protein